MARETKPVVPETKFQTYYNRYHKDEQVWFDPESSLTDQDFRDMCDINYLIAHMAGHNRTPIYGIQDNSTFEDWHNEMALIKRRFNDLDPVKRAEFGNAQKFLAWCADPANYSDQLNCIVEGKAEVESRKREKLRKEQTEDRLAGKIAKAIKGE